MEIEKNAQDVILNIINGQIIDGRILIKDKLYSLEELRSYISMNFDQKSNAVKLCAHKRRRLVCSMTDYDSNLDKVVVSNVLACENCNTGYIEKIYRDVLPPNT